MGILPQDNGFGFPVGYTPDLIQLAYGLGNIKFGSVTGDGKGQTIAVVDAYDDPDFLDSTDSNFVNSDLAQFDAQLGIPDPPSFTKVNQSGQTTSLPGTDPAGAGNINGNWEIEEALDIEWAHAVAPGANIVLVEATTDSNSNLFAAVKTAAGLPGVSAVSMSWGVIESSGEQSLDSTFVTPQGHQGVTFLAASGDGGGFAYDSNGQLTTTPGVLYPASSPNVVGVGGTTLVLNSDGTYNSETAWSGSGGGTSLFEPEPAYQKGVQQTGHRTVPDVSFVADPTTGVAVYDSYNDTDDSGQWVEVGGTSLAAPAWAGLIAIANQGRVLGGAKTLDGPGQTLPAVYAISSGDFNDIVSGNNGVFSAGTGYDEVTGLGTPKVPLVDADLATYGTASQLGVIAQPPTSLIAGDSFGIVVAAENHLGGVDPAFNGTVTISLAANPGGGTLGGTLTVTAYHGVAVFDGLTLVHPGTGYTLQVATSSFPKITTVPFNVISNPTPWQATFYPVPTDASLRAAISKADSNAYAYNTIVLSASTYLLSSTTAGQLLIDNASSLPVKTVTIVGRSETSSIIGSVTNWHDRIFEIQGSSKNALNVTFQNLTIEGGAAQNGGVVGGTAALGGGLLIASASVTLNGVLLQDNQAEGAPGVAGAGGKPGGPGGKGGKAQNVKGGAIYLSSGSLFLFNDTLSDNFALGGRGGQGGEGGGQGTKLAAGVAAGAGGPGGTGGSAAGGGLYAAGGTVVLTKDSFTANQAIGGEGGDGGVGGSGGRGSALAVPPVPGKQGGAGGSGGLGGASSGGAIYLASGALTLTGSMFKSDSASGGAGGQGGTGGPGTAVVGSITGIFGGSGSFPGLTGLSGLNGLLGRGGPGGNGGPGGAGGLAAGGGVYVAGGSLTFLNSTVAVNQAVGGAGGVGGQGGTAGFGGTVSGLPAGQVAGKGGAGGVAGPAHGGGINVAGGTLVLTAGTVNADIAQGGAGGMGGSGGYGPIAAVFGGSGISTGTGGIGGTGGTGGGTALNSAGAGGNGGNGATGRGGGLYVSGGTLTLTNATLAANSADAGAKGSGGQGGHAGTGNLTGGPGIAGVPGNSEGGGMYVTGGVVNLFNTTIALNIQSGSGYGGGVVQAAGTVTAISTLFAGNGPVDYSGNINASNSLFQTKPINGTLSGSANLVQVNPLLASSGLQNNGGPTQTIALQSLSPALGAGANPEKLFTDQRGYAPRTGAGGTDIGAYQHDAKIDTQSPTAALQAVAVTNANAATLNPYTFTITFSDNVAIAAASLSGLVVQVVPPGAVAPITATVASTKPVGSTDANGNAQAFLVTFHITPPNGSWTFASNGTYTITLGGARVTDLAGNTVATSSLGTFKVSIKLAAAVVVTSTLAGSTYGQSISFKAIVSPAGPTPTGTIQFVVDGTNFGTAVTLSGGSAKSLSTALLGAGKHTIQAIYSGDSNYLTGNGSYTQVVNQAPLFIVPDNLSRPVGQANPKLTYTFTGFVNGQTASTAGITGSANLATTATTSSPAGQYPITVTNAGTLAAANYDFPAADFKTGTLTVTQVGASAVVYSSPPSSTYGQPISLTLTGSNGTVTAVNPDSTSVFVHPLVSNSAGRHVSGAASWHAAQGVLVGRRRGHGQPRRISLPTDSSTITARRKGLS